LSELQIKVLIVEDDAIVRAWVHLAVEGTEFNVVGEATTVADGAVLYDRRRPDVLLVDHRLPDGVGTDLVRELRGRGITAPVLMMSASPQRGLNDAARLAGANGSVLKSGDISELLGALRIVRRGGESFDYRHPGLDRGQAPLSPREREILTHIAEGKTNAEIAEALGVGRETVKTMVKRLQVKLGSTRRAEAVDEAHRRGIL
jgi:DNA-binding NarL/FixJ family response regulator